MIGSRVSQRCVLYFRDALHVGLLSADIVIVRTLTNRAILLRTARNWATDAIAILLALGIAEPIAAQPVASVNEAQAATVTFTLDFPASTPAHYSIAVDANGRARYECVGKIAEDSEAQTYRAEFEVSGESRKRIFEWAKQAKFFVGKIDSGNRKLAFTGAKVLSYQEGQTSNLARYNFSSLEPVRQLTALFQNMANTLEYGHRLAYYHHYQKLALDDELKRMETQARNNELSEIQSVAPVLSEICDDFSVMNVVRARAKQLMQMGNSAGRQ